MPLRWSTSASSLLLQTIVYYNTWYSLVHAFFAIGVLWYKMVIFELDDVTLILSPLLTGIWAILEAARLWLGYSGNLRERVPELAAFLLLTIPQIPIVIVIGLAPIWLHFPVEQILAVPALILYIAEMFIAYGAVRQFMARQTAAFFRSVQEEGAEDENARRPPTETVVGGGVGDTGRLFSGGDRTHEPNDYDVSMMDSQLLHTVRRGETEEEEDEDARVVLPRDEDEHITRGLESDEDDDFEESNASGVRRRK